MKSGIYFIRNLLNNKFYVGSAVNFDSRWSKHKHDLNNQIHHCGHLQNAWNIYGEQFFIFERVEYIENEDLLVPIEQTYLDKYFDNGINCYNSCPVAGSWLGMHHSEETKEHLSLQKQGSNNVGAKLTEKDVERIKQLLFDNKLMIKEIAQFFDIDKTIISKMIAGERWTHCFTDEELRQLQQIQKDNKEKRMTGENNHMYGKPVTDEAKIKISNSLKGKMIGTNNPMSKLTPEIVVEIKKTIELNKYTQRELANMFHVGQCTISEIKTGKRWAHIKVTI